jgi:hypothetical protein
VSYSSCPTTIVNAPVQIIWELLMNPDGWGDFFDVRIIGMKPEGRAAVGQEIYAESGPSFLHLKVEFKFVAIDSDRHRLGLEIRLPFGVSVKENLECAALDLDHCRVNYGCDFSFPTGWRGAIVRLVLRRELDAGPIDSLARLKRAAEQFYGLAPS